MGGVTKEYKETFSGECVHYLDCNDCFMNIYILQNSSNCILYIIVCQTVPQ